MGTQVRVLLKSGSAGVSESPKRHAAQVFSVSTGQVLEASEQVIGETVWDAEQMAGGSYWVKVLRDGKSGWLPTIYVEYPLPSLPIG